MTLRFAVAGWLLDGRPSGAARRLHSVLRAAPEHLAADEEIHLLLGEGSAMPAGLRGGVHCHRVSIPAGPTAQRARATARLLPELLEDLGAAVLELGALPVPVHMPCPVVVTVHDLRDLDGWRRCWMRPFLPTIYRRTLARAAAVTVPSAFTAARYRAHRLPGDPVVIPNGVAPVAEQDGARDGPTWFLHVGHLERRKNLDLLLTAYARAAAAGPSPFPELIFAGRDAGRGTALHRRARTLGIADRVTFAGTVSEEELHRLLSGARALLFPSRYEGFGLPALEALARGTAVCAADAGALPEVVGDAGTVLSPRDPSAWARAMGDCASTTSPVAARTARRARAASFSWNEVARSTVALWRGVARGERQLETSSITR